MGFSSLFIILLTVSISLVIPRTNATLPEIPCPIESIYQFGASKCDTGNQIRILPAGPTLSAAHLPYGETFPGRPTGRWSDGALVIDFTARRLGLPLLNPYLHKNASFEHGVNFAIGGSTAADFSFYQAKGIVTPSTASLNIQLGWFREHLSSICSTPTVCAKKLEKALFFMGEIGSNDINYGLQQNKSLEEIKAYVPFINHAIANATREVIKAGANRVVVPGNYPIGCFPFGLILRPSNDSTAYDKFGCLISLNQLAIYQNSHLKLTLNSLKKEFPHVTILYADYYAAFQTILLEAHKIGFPSNTLSKACVVTGQSPAVPLRGNSDVQVCPIPSRYIYWDVVHLTQHANYLIAGIINKDLSLKIKCFR